MNVDLLDFFGSVSFYRVRGVFLNPPISLPWNVSTILAHICCRNGVLPQGAPTSPPLSNFVCRALDSQLQELAQECRGTYTRYADDISFSFSRRVRARLPERVIASVGSASPVGSEVAKVLASNGFSINSSKVRLQHFGQRMEVTGLTVNDVPNVRRRYVDEIRRMLHIWERYGLAAASSTFASQMDSRQKVRKSPPRFEAYLRGKLSFLKMVKGEADRVYVKLGRKFNELVSSTHGCTVKPLLIADTVIEERELDSAVYVIRCVDMATMQESQGTAFFLRNHGIVTCDHVVRYPAERVTAEDSVLPNGYFGFSAGKIYLEDRSGTVICEAKVEKTCAHADIAILSPCTAPSRKILSLTSSQIRVRKGQSATLVGFPDHTAGKGLSVVRAHVINDFVRSAVQLFDINEQIRKGNSGGPILNDKLQVVGIAIEGQKDMRKSNAAVVIAMIDQLLIAGAFSPPTTTPVPVPVTPPADARPPSLFGRCRVLANKFFAYFSAPST